MSIESSAMSHTEILASDYGAERQENCERAEGRSRVDPSTKSAQEIRPPTRRRVDWRTREIGTNTLMQGERRWAHRSTLSRQSTSTREANLMPQSKKRGGWWRYICCCSDATTISPVGEPQALGLPMSSKQENPKYLQFCGCLIQIKKNGYTAEEYKKLYNVFFQNGSPYRLPISDDLQKEVDRVFFPFSQKHVVQSEKKVMKVLLKVRLTLNSA